MLHLLCIVFWNLECPVDGSLDMWSWPKIGTEEKALVDLSRCPRKVGTVGIVQQVSEVVCTILSNHTKQRADWTNRD